MLFRPSSLQRLLISLDSTDFSFKKNNPGWQVELEIHVDGGGGIAGEEVARLAHHWTWKHGKKKVVLAEQNHGLVASWRDAWIPEERQLAVIFEDDAEVSPQ